MADRKEYEISGDLWHRATDGLTKISMNFNSGITITTPPTLRETWEFIAKELRFKRETVKAVEGRPRNVISAEPLD
jgi:hypothetical protein